MNVRRNIEGFRNATQYWVKSNLSAAGFSPMSLWDTPLILRNLTVGGLWYLAATIALALASHRPESPLSDYILKGADETLSPTLWNLVSTIGLLGFGVTLVVPRISTITNWSRHVLLSAFITGCLMLATLTVRFISFLGSPAENFGEYYWAMIPLSGVLLVTCYALNFFIAYLATLVHPHSGFMKPLQKLTPGLRIGGGAIVLVAVVFGMAGTSY